MNKQNISQSLRPQMQHGQRLRLALEVIKQCPFPLTKQQIERRAGIQPFNTERWLRFQESFQNEIVVHPITQKVHWIGHEGAKDKRVEGEGI